MALIICPECEKNVSDKAVSCPGCGFPIAEYLWKNAPKKCPECGAMVPQSDAVCAECGFPFQHVDKNTSDEYMQNERSENVSANRVETHFITSYTEQDFFTQVIDSIVTNLKAVSIIWVIIGCVQLAVVLYWASLLKNYEGNTNWIAVIGVVAIYNIVSGVMVICRPSRFQQKPEIIWDSLRLTVRDVIVYVWNFVCSGFLFMSGGWYVLLGILMLSAVLIEIIGVKVKLGNNKTMLIGIKEQAERRREKEIEISMNDDELPGDYWACPKCEGPIKHYPCKYCGYDR